METVDASVDSDKKVSKSNVGDHVRVSKHKNIFAKRYTSNWSKEVLGISKIQNKVTWAYAI